MKAVMKVRSILEKLHYANFASKTIIENKFKFVRPIDSFEVQDLKYRIRIPINFMHIILKMPPEVHSKIASLELRTTVNCNFIFFFKK